MLPTRDPLNAFLDLPDVPVANAATGPLAGLSLGVKDIFDVAGYVTGCGNPEKFAEGEPARATAPAVQKLLDAGARFAGKTQTEELAFSMLGQNVHFPHPVNPAAPDRVTGGSSSGSVAAVAGGLADIATGSDTGGSVRAPASFCGLIGLRTTHGRISLEGTMPLAPSFDTFGWFASDIETYETVGEVLLGQDAPRNPAHPAAFGRSARRARRGPAEAAEYTRHASASIAGVTGQPDASGAAVQTTDELYWCMRKLQAREAWAAHGDWITGREDRLGKATLERFGFGKTVVRRRCRGRDRPGATPSAPSCATCSATTASSSCRPRPARRPRATARPKNSRRFRERAICTAVLVRPFGFPADHACRSARSTARPSASRCSARPTATVALISLGIEILDRRREGLSQWTR